MLNNISIIVPETASEMIWSDKAGERRACLLLDKAASRTTSA